jgi:tetratricopeptide (TPR) repeat protein
MAVDIPQETFLQGVEYLKKNRLHEASNALRAAFKSNPDNPLYLSYYGLVVALEEDCMQDGITFCRAAIQRAPYESELYLNLSRIYQKAEQRQQALAILVQGLSYDPASLLLKREMRRMGMRRKAFFSALSRDNALNKILGKLTYQMKKNSLLHGTQHSGH